MDTNKQYMNEECTHEEIRPLGRDLDEFVRREILPSIPAPPPGFAPSSNIKDALKLIPYMLVVEIKYTHHSPCPAVYVINHKKQAAMVNWVAFLPLALTLACARSYGHG